MFKNLELSEVNSHISNDEDKDMEIDKIINLLVFAGYHRAQIKGLANFDKIIGGMAWCIESCNFDIDIDLLYQENLTIGQKISLTEKIVSMLPKMFCPYQIEPHQIQGLDCNNILPIIQWLVNQSMKIRQEMAGYVRFFAIIEFNKHRYDLQLQMRKKNFNKNDIITKLQQVRVAYDPCSKFKQKYLVEADEFYIVSNTLLEYGETLQISQTIINQLQKMKNDSLSIDKETTKEFIDRKILEKGKVDKLLENLLKTDDKVEHISTSNIEKIMNLQAKEVVMIAKKYSKLSNYEFQKKESSFTKILPVLKKQRKNLKTKFHKLDNDKIDLFNKVSKTIELLCNERTKKQFINVKLLNLKTINSDNQELFSQLEIFLKIHDGLKNQDSEFRHQCHSELNLVNELIKNIEIRENKEEVTQLNEIDKQKQVVNSLRLKLAKQNRAIVTLIRRLDDVPGRSELTQYQKRFLELYNQVSEKHRETKQFYTLYNTLDDTKLYLAKELSLLNSIQDNYKQAMISSCKKEEFMKQFKFIVEEVQKNKERVEKRHNEDKINRDILISNLVTLMEQQRKYVAAVQQLTIECRKNELLLAKLR